MRKTLIAAAATLPMLATPALAYRPPGVDTDSPIARWFMNQNSITGQWCCDLSDAHVLDDDEWGMSGLGYWIKVDGVKYPVPPSAVRNPRGGPNPTGHAIAWWGPVFSDGKSAKGINIFCFTPGTMF